MSKIIHLLPHFFKVRLLAKRYDIWKEVQDDKREPDGFMSGDWISYDGNIYYGHPLGIFFYSEQNNWHKLKQQHHDTSTD